MKTVKKTLAIAALAACLASQRLDAQIGAVTAPILEGIMQATHLDQVIYYAQMIQQQIQAAQNTYEQWQHLIRSEQRALDNLKGITSVSSFDEFMNWYNRQLYLERETENRFHNLGVKIGNKTYKLKDIDQIPDAVNKTYGLEYWNNFTEDQRREMWYNLGLTPANYQYVQTWKAKEKEIASILLTNAKIVNDENMESAERMAALRKMFTDNPDIGEKGVLQAVFEVLLDTNTAIRKQNYDTALYREYEAARDKKDYTPPNPPMLSEHYKREIFDTEYEWRAVDDDY